ncbi:MAG TPA: type II toxin-antitoxin system VapC family toxin [Thermomicrobiales bacterium]|jgi:predicted nucleic acid-binding protein
MAQKSRSSLVIDASVTVKWFLEDEELIAEARALRADSLVEARRLVGPPLLFAEATNAIYQRFRRKDLSERDVDRFVAALWAQQIEVLAPLDLIQRAYRFVRQHRLANVYDSHYVILAQQLGIEFWTGDERIYNSVHAVAPWVRWLGDYASGDDDA